MKKVAVVVPGILGSVLGLNGRVIWPGPLTSLMFGYSTMQELMDPALQAVDLIRRYSVTTQYQQLIDDLTAWGYRLDDGTQVLFPYDWRRDNALTAASLATRLDRVVAELGDDTEISLIGHSMGGLVARHYLESGLYGTRPAFKQVRKLITLGTPHFGAPLALSMVLGLEKQLFLSKEQVQEAASDPRYPSTYQLLPPSEFPFVWNPSSGKELARVDVLGQTAATKLGLLAQNVEAGRTFRQSLDFAKRPTHVRYFCFAGTRQSTATHLRIANAAAGGGGLTALKIETSDGGDGTVPTWSAIYPGIQCSFVGGEHGTIYKDAKLRRELAILMGHPGVLAGVPSRAGVAVRDRVVEPADRVHVAISFEIAVPKFIGYLTVERASLDDQTGEATAFDAPIQVHRVEYDGPGLETMSLQFDAPEMRGVYRVSLRDEPDAEPAGFDELMVQEPTT